MKHAQKSPEAEEQGVLQETRLWVLFIALAGAGLTYWFTVRFQVSIFDLVYVVVIAQMVLLPAVLATLFSQKKNRRFGAVSIVSGLLAGLGTVAYGIPAKKPDVLTLSPLIALAIATVFWTPSLWLRTEK